MTQPSSLHLSSPQPTRVHIPPELFEPIISHVAERSILLSLCLTNQLLRYSAEKQLYSIVADLENRDLQIKFLTVITQTPRLALYVKEYRSYSIISSSGDPALRELTHDGLVAMKGLKVLIFRESSGQPCAEILDMDNGVAFQLIKLHWGSHSDENSMRKVLLQQGRTLRELYLQSRSGTLFPLAACPHLDYLSANYHTIEALLSGRHVTRLRWVPDLFDPFSHFGKLEDVKKELDQIRTLHLGGYFGRPHLKCLSGYFSKLEALELVGLYDAEEIHFVYQFSWLQVLVFSPQPAFARYPITYDCRREIVEELFRQCPKLLCVDMVQEDANVLFSELNYQRLERTSTQPRLVSVTEVRNGKFPWWNV